MTLKKVCVSVAITVSMTTGMIFVSQAHVLAQNSQTQTENANSRASKSLEIRWFLGFIPWPQWTRNSTNYNAKLISKNQEYNHKEVPVPILIPGLAVLGVSLIRKYRQEQKQIETKSVSLLPLENQERGFNSFE